MRKWNIQNDLELLNKQYGKENDKKEDKGERGEKSESSQDSAGVQFQLSQEKVQQGTGDSDSEKGSRRKKGKTKGNSQAV